VILLDQASGASRRILPDNSREIAGVWLLPASAGASPDEPVDPLGAAPSKPQTSAYYVLAVNQQQGGLKDLLVGDLASGKQSFVLSGIDGIDEIWMLSPTRIALLLRDKMKLHYRVIDVPTLKVVASRPVDIG
jgi:hypothetical protein